MLASIQTQVEDHILADRAAFDAIQATLLEIRGDIKSLLETRSMARGLWRAASVTGGILTAVGAVVAWLIGYFHAPGPPRP